MQERRVQTSKNKIQKYFVITDKLSKVSFSLTIVCAPFSFHYYA